MQILRRTGSAIIDHILLLQAVCKLVVTNITENQGAFAMFASSKPYASLIQGAINLPHCRMPVELVVFHELPIAPVEQSIREYCKGVGENTGTTEDVVLAYNTDAGGTVEAHSVWTRSASDPSVFNAMKKPRVGGYYEIKFCKEPVSQALFDLLGSGVTFSYDGNVIFYNELESDPSSYADLLRDDVDELDVVFDLNADLATDESGNGFALNKADILGASFNPESRVFSAGCIDFRFYDCNAM